MYNKIKFLSEVCYLLYSYEEEDKLIKPVKYCDYSELGGKEKDLENLLASNLQDLYSEGEVSLMTIFQERSLQEEADIFALDVHGNLVIFELKCGNAGRGAVEQTMRYAERFGKKDYAQLNNMYRKYTNNNAIQLRDEHASAFELSAPLSDEAFNRQQKLVIVGNSADSELINAVDYWKNQGINIDFMPYRFYKIDGKIYFEFFAKPYDYHLNPRDKKGIMFDTNLSYSSDNEKCMLARKHIEAYGDAKWAVDSFSKGDYALFYSKGRGIIAIGEITSHKAKELDGAADAQYGCRYHEVRMIVPQNVSDPNDYNKSIYPFEIKDLLNRGFYFAKVDKRPYLSEEQVKILIEALQKKYDA